MKKSLRQLLDASGELTVKNPRYRSLVLRYTEEECRNEAPDITGSLFFPKAILAKAFIRSCEGGVLAGRDEIEFFLQREGLRAKFFFRNGERFRSGSIIAEIFGDVRAILLAERATLNFLGRMSGVATKAVFFVKRGRRVNPSIEIACTRKTLWGLLDKKACAVGGGLTHRLNLSDAVMIKDNHRAVFSGHLEDAVTACEDFFKKGTKNTPRFFEIETDTPAQAVHAAALIAAQKIVRPWIIMLDNFSPKKIVQTLLQIKKNGHLRPDIFFEASGGIHEKNIAAYARSGVDFLSIGALTKNAPVLDFSLDMVKAPRGLSSQ